MVECVHQVGPTISCDSHRQGYMELSHLYAISLDGSYSLTCSTCLGFCYIVPRPLFAVVDSGQVLLDMQG